MNNNQRYNQYNDNTQPQTNAQSNYPQRFQGYQSVIRQQRPNFRPYMNYGAQQNQRGNPRNFPLNVRFPQFARPNQNFTNQNQFQNHQANQKWRAKRNHDQVETASTSSSRRSETSPAPKRQLQKQNSLEALEMPMLAPATPQQMQKLAKKKNENLPAKTASAAKENEWKEMFTKALNFLGSCQPGEEVSLLLNYLQPPRHMWNNVKDQIYNDMMALMAPLGVKRMLVFGSTLTGLDFKGSDLDYHISLLNPPVNEEEVKQVISKTTKLVRFSHHFHIVFSVTHARVPIVRLVHYITNVFCDVNFTSPFGYCNSQFIGTVLTFDSRIKDLAVILKLWSKATKISERMIISNYCLVMLLIFYLQNLPQPMLDSLRNNQKCGRTNSVDNKYRWNFFFNDKINKSKQNTHSTRELLVGFFKFYLELNRRDNIVCIYNGQLIERKQFEIHPDLQFYREVVEESQLPVIKYDNPETFVVQDAFEQNLNIGIKAKKHCEIFFAAIEASNEMCGELKDQPMSHLLVKLFTDLKFEKEVENKNIAKKKKMFQMTIHSIAGDLKLCQDILVHQDKDKICSVEDQQIFFFNHVYEGIKNFLQDIYLCTIVLAPDSSNPDPFCKWFKMVLDVDTVNGRKKINFKDETSVNNEKKVSNMMKEKKIPMEIESMVKISSKDNGKSVVIEMIDCAAKKKSGLPNFGTFFAVNISPALKYYLKTLWDATRSTNL